MINPDKCCGCSACANACPKQCISIIQDNLGFLKPFIDNKVCIHCNQCEKVCPMIAEKAESEKPHTWGGHAKDDKIRAASSSGGLFSILATHILSNSGVVFGASYNPQNGKVSHIIIDKISELSLLQGSKYVQSDISNMFSLAKEKLDEGVQVLFSGTPCQIEGLVRYLKKDYSNLVTVEVICHGVTAPALFDRYKNEMEKRFKSKIKRIAFRDEQGG